MPNNPPPWFNYSAWAAHAQQDLTVTTSTHTTHPPTVSLGLEDTFEELLKGKQMADYNAEFVPFSFTFPVHGSTKLITLTDFSECFDPRKNPLGEWPLNTERHSEHVMKEVFKHNSAFIFDQLSRQGPFMARWVKAFKNEIPQEDWYHLGMFVGMHCYGDSIEFASKWAGTETTTKSKNLAETFKSYFKIHKDFTTRTNNGALNGCSLPVIGEIVRWFAGHMTLTTSFKGVKKLAQLREMITNGSTFELKVNYNQSANQVYFLEKGIIQMTLDYSNRSELYKVFEYTTKITSVVGEQDWTKGSGQFNLFGTELEVATDYDAKHIIDAFPEIFAFCKKDATVSGSKRNKFEIVTIPSTLRSQKKNWAHFFKNLNEDMFDVLDKHTNGMHVHIDRKAFMQDVSHLKKFCFFFTNPANHKFLMEISERDQKGIDEHAKIVKSKSVKDSERSIQNNGRKTVINLGNAATVEVRMFKGIVCYASIIKNLEFVDSVVEFTKVTGFNNLGLRDYLQYLKDLPDSYYRTLRMCIEDMNLIDMIMMARFEEIIGKATGPAEAVLKLNQTTEAISGSVSKRIQTLFNKSFESLGCRVEFENSVFVLIREGTRFSKFNGYVEKLYSRVA